VVNAVVWQRVLNVPRPPLRLLCTRRRPRVIRTQAVAAHPPQPLLVHAEELLLRPDDTWEKQVLSARGFKRVERRSEYAI
jgi:hypothetical protein